MSDYISEKDDSTRRDLDSAIKKVEKLKSLILNMNDGQKNLISEIESVLAILKKINEIAKTVALIAEKTQLISVNASIEAARSGVEGKSFSVIAQEIKSLAGESQHTVKQIETFTAEITKSINKVLNNIQSDHTKLEEQSEFVTSLLPILNKILDDIN